MNKNTDKDIVVMNRKIFDDLSYLASVGSGEVWGHEYYDQLIKHCRRFNQVLKEENQVKLQNEMSLRKELRKKTIELAKRKKLFYRDSSTIYEKVKVIGVPKASETWGDTKLCIKVYFPRTGEKSVVAIQNLFGELPHSNFYLCTEGYWEGRLLEDRNTGSSLA